MKQKNGYTVPELLGVIIIVGFIAFIGITKVSYAFESISNPETQKEEMQKLVEQASIAYATNKKEDFKKETETYIYAKEVAAAGFLFEKDEYNSMKVKITYNSEKDTFSAEVVA